MSIPSRSSLPLSGFAVLLLASTGPITAENLLSPSDTVVGGQRAGTEFVVGGGGWPGNEPPAAAIDGVGQKYLNFGRTDTGIVVTPANGISLATSITFYNANDAMERAPASFELWGSNEIIGGGNISLSDFSLIASGALNPGGNTNPGGNAPLGANNETVQFANGDAYTSYMILFPTIQNLGGANSMQISEIVLEGITGPPGDTDGDGLSDAYEDANGLDASDDGSTGESSPGAKDGPNGALGDPDGDDLSNAEERDLGTDPQDNDSDQDGALDGVETNTGVWLSESDTGTDPLNPDSDDDTLLDGTENPALPYDPNDPTTQPGTDPNLDDTDGDTVPDGEEIAAGRNPTFADPLPPTIFRPGDPILGGQIIGNNFEVGGVGGGGNNWPGGEGPEHAIDGVGQKYLNFAKFNAGVLVTPSGGPSVAASMTLWAANDAVPRDPSSYELYGTTADVTGPGPFALDQFTLISSGDLALPDSRNQGGNADLDDINSQDILFNNSTAYTSYLIVFPTVKDSASANSMQIAEIQLTGRFGAGTRLRFEVDGPGDELVFTFDSQSGKVYDILSSTDPETEPDSSSWAVWQENIAATPPENAETYTRPADPRRFFVLVEKEAPPFFVEDFESGQGGWTTGVNDANGQTTWELGTPLANTGPITGADGSANAFTTNIGDYADNADIFLRSPVIDLTGAGITSATLTMDHWRDADSFVDLFGVRILRASDLGLLGDIDPDSTVVDPDWESFSEILPASAVGEEIVLEFWFTSDASADAFSGWSIDNVEIDVQ